MGSIKINIDEAVFYVSRSSKSHKASASHKRNLVDGGTLETINLLRKQKQGRTICLRDIVCARHLLNSKFIGTRKFLAEKEKTSTKTLKCHDGKMIAKPQWQRNGEQQFFF